MTKRIRSEEAKAAARTRHLECEADAGVESIRLTDPERDLVERAAHAAGISIGSWIRLVAVKAAETSGRKSAKPIVPTRLSVRI